VAPALLKAWHLPKTQLGLAFGIGMTGFMIGALMLGQLGDRFGRKVMIVCGAIVFGVFTAATGLVSTVNALFLLRFIAGIGLGGTVPNCIALSAEFAPIKKRGAKVSEIYLGYLVGSALSGLIAAKYVPLYGWPIAFYVGGFIPLLLVPVLMFGLPESIRFLALKDSDPKRLAKIVARFRPDLHLDPGVRFVVRGKPQPGMPVQHLFTDGRAWGTCLLWIAVIGSLMALHFFTSWLPTVIEGSGAKTSYAIIATVLFQTGGIVGVLTISRLLDKHGVKSIVASLAVAAVLIISIGYFGKAGVFLLMALVFFAGTFLIGAQVSLLVLPGMMYPTYVRATGAGWAYGIGRFGSILGPVVGGFLISVNLSLQGLFLCASIPVIWSAVATSFLQPKRRIQPDNASHADETPDLVGTSVPVGRATE